MSILLANGSGQYLSLPNEADYDLVTGISITCWMLHTGLWKATWETIIAKGDGQWRLGRLSSGGGRGLHWATSGTSLNYHNWDGIVDDGLWHFIGATFQSGSPGSKYLFVDGAYVISDPAVTGTIANTAYVAYIGENAQSTGRYFDGILHDVRLYNRGLSFTELMAIWSQNGGDGVHSGMVGRWIGNQGAPGATITGTVRDLGSLQHNATPVASPVWGISNRGSRRRRAL